MMGIMIAVTNNMDQITATDPLVTVTTSKYIIKSRISHLLIKNKIL